ncbi:MAG: ABC transporter ATP-binding protein [Clostridia bacterium]|nr:ABC transporter ATP-binding protein [Clostridia bacterium]
MNNCIEIRQVNKSFGKPSKKGKEESLSVLADISLSLRENEFVSLLGPSGCGKSTLLKLVAGLDSDYTGDILINGVNPKEQHVSVCYMLQKDCLMPWRTVLSNILLPVEIQKGSLKEQGERLKPLLSEFGLEGFENYRPHQLSGGMRQRAALLRTYLMKGDLMLLDEPFGALDELTRMQMQNWLIDIWERHKKTVLFVTHNLEEAVLLSDRVLVMSNRPGKIICEIPITFKRPRQRELLLDPAFLEYKGKIIEALANI